MRAGLAERARIVLLAADGVSNTVIADRVGMSRPTVIDWRHITSAVESPGWRTSLRRVGRGRWITTRSSPAPLTPPPKRLGVTHWSSRLLGHASADRQRDGGAGLTRLRGAAVAGRAG